MEILSGSTAPRGLLRSNPGLKGTRKQHPITTCA